MNSTLAAQLTLLAYALIAVVLMVRAALRFEYGIQAWFLFGVARAYCGLLFHWRSRGRCPFPRDGAAIVIANHSSPVDPILLWMNNHLRAEGAQPRVISFLTASEYYSARGVAWICRAMRSIPVDRNGRDMKPTREALRLLQQGEFVGVFPEGGINLERDLRPAVPGVAWLALKARVPVYPVYIENAPRGDDMISPFMTPARVVVHYGEPVDLSEFTDQRVSHELLERLADRLMLELARLGGTGVQSRDGLAPLTPATSAGTTAAADHLNHGSTPGRPG